MSTTVARIAGITSSGIFAGYTWALSDAAVAAILAAHDEKTMARQWRIQFIRGFIVSVPSTIINLLSWTLLAYRAPSSSLARTLFTTAALTTGSGTVFAWTFLRAVNGALSIRSSKLAGPWTGTWKIPLTYSFKEQAARKLEERLSTMELVQKWRNFNLLRSVILIAGMVVGAWGLVLES